MAVTPAEAAQISEGERLRADQLEREIDELIRHHAQWDESVFIVIVRTPCRPRTREELTKRYEEAGWVVKWHDDQLDGLSIQLQPKQ